MPFGLKNIGVTYQRLVNLGDTIGLYINDMIVKSLKIKEHKTPDILSEYRWKLNQG